MLNYVSTLHVFEKVNSVIGIDLIITNINNIIGEISVSSSLHNEKSGEDLYTKATLHIILFDNDGVVYFDKTHLKRIIEEHEIDDISYAVNDILQSIEHVQGKISIAIMKQFLKIGDVVDSSILGEYTERFIIKGIQES